MSCKLPDCVERYLKSIEEGKPRANREMNAFAEWVRRIFETEKITVNERLLERYLRLAKYYDFERLFPWEETLIALWLCTFRADGMPRFRTAFAMIGRGAGKDGAMSFCSMCLLSPYNPAKKYDVDICANNEEQALTPVFDLTAVLENPKWEARLDKFYSHRKEEVVGRKNGGRMRGRTNNPKGRDGMRSGVVIFNEVHAFENYDNIKVFTTGLGKKEHPRIGIFTSNGDVADGPLDDYLARGRRILFDGEDDAGFLPMIYCLNDVEEVHDKENWHKANPSLAYRPTLMQETEDEYQDWLLRPEQNGDFITKRMGIRAGQKEIMVTDYEKIRATNQPLPELKGRPCIVGIDYAELSDWAAVNLHFRIGEKRYDINHAWVCLQSKTLTRVKAPWKAWAEKGLITVVDDVSISANLLAEYISEQGKKYSVRKIAMDGFRWTLVADALKGIGFDAKDKARVKLVRPSDIMRIEPVIQECFDRSYFAWGDVPHLRWAVNNTKRVKSSKKMGVDTGNYIYAKIEAKSRKTDPWMALVASMTCEEELGNGRTAQRPRIGAVAIR